MSKMLKMELLGNQAHAQTNQAREEIQPVAGDDQGVTALGSPEPSRMGPLSYLLLIAVALGLGAVTWRAWGPMEQLKGTASSAAASAWELAAPEEEAYAPPVVAAEPLIAPEPPVLPPVQPELEALPPRPPPSPAPLKELAVAEPPLVADRLPVESPPATTLVEPINGHFHL